MARREHLVSRITGPVFPGMEGEISRARRTLQRAAVSQIIAE